MQQQHIESESDLLQGKNLEIEHAVEDLVKIIAAYQFDSIVERVSDDEISKLKKHYNHFMYQALLHCTGSGAGQGRLDAAAGALPSRGPPREAQLAAS